MPRRKDGEETRNKILKAAAVMFARNGFKNTTNADIVNQCGGINAALINYYFSDKATLYQQAWEYAYSEAVRELPLREKLQKCHSPEEKLLTVIETSLCRNATSDSVVNGMIHHEISAMTGILTDLYARTFFDMQRLLRSIVDEILGNRVPAIEKDLSVYSILSMLLIPIRKIRSMDHRKSESPDFDLSQRIRHVQQFALGGLEKLKQQYEKTDPCSGILK